MKNEKVFNILNNYKRLVSFFIYCVIIVVVVLMNMGPEFCCAESGYIYECKKTVGRCVHVVEINPQIYKIEIVKAVDIFGIWSRETVAHIARRSGATIAINGGFFHYNGKPSGTLKINNKLYRRDHRKHTIFGKTFNEAMDIVTIGPSDLRLLDDYVSCVQGIPRLLECGVVPLFTKQQTSLFYTAPHARTAIGIKADGAIIIVVVEHCPEAGILGYTIMELAHMMNNELGCQSAVNMDGGGSSTLWIEGNVVNCNHSNEYFFNSWMSMRAVSDAIVFLKK